MSVMPKVITAEFFRRCHSDKIRYVAIALGYVGTSMVKGMNKKVLEKILGLVPIGRLIEPDEVGSLVGELYQNDAITGEDFFIHGGLRLGSKSSLSLCLFQTSSHPDHLFFSDTYRYPINPNFLAIIWREFDILIFRCRVI